MPQTANNTLRYAVIISIVFLIMEVVLAEFIFNLFSGRPAKSITSFFSNDLPVIYWTLQLKLLKQLVFGLVVFVFIYKYQLMNQPIIKLIRCFGLACLLAIGCMYPALWLSYDYFLNVHLYILFLLVGYVVSIWLALRVFKLTVDDSNQHQQPLVLSANAIAWVYTLLLAGSLAIMFWYQTFDVSLTNELSYRDSLNDVIGFYTLFISIIFCIGAAFFYPISYYGVIKPIKEQQDPPIITSFLLAVGLVCLCIIMLVSKFIIFEFLMMVFTQALRYINSYILILLGIVCLTGVVLFMKTRVNCVVFNVCFIIFSILAVVYVGYFFYNILIRNPRLSDEIFRYVIGISSFFSIIYSLFIICCYLIVTIPLRIGFRNKL